MAINFHIKNQLVRELKSFTIMEDERDRRSFISWALGNNQSLLERIQWSGSVATFVPELVDVLVDYGKNEDGESPLSSLLKNLASQVGVDRQESLNILIEQMYERSNVSPVKKQSQVNSSNIYNKMNIFCEDLQEAFNLLNINFVGRGEELNELEQLINQRQYRAIALIGMSGIGKSTLAAKLLEKVKTKFDFIIWKNFRRYTSFQDYLHEIFNCFLVKHENEITFQSEINDKIEYLIHCFNQNKCLLILDNVTEIVQYDNGEREYKVGWKEFGNFLEQVAQRSHDSCLLITSHQLFKELENPKIQNYCYNKTIDGINAKDLRNYWSLYYLYTEPNAGDDFEFLAEYYGGHPTVLNIVTQIIRETYDGNVSKYLEFKIQGSVAREICEFLDRQFTVLSELEKSIMYWLAIENKAMTMADIKSVIKHDIIPIKKLEFLSFIKKEKVCCSGNQDDSSIYIYSQLPVVKDYVTNLLIAEIVSEIARKQPSILNEYLLLKADAPDYIKEQQRRDILEPIKNQVLKKMGSSNKLVKEHFTDMLSAWREKEPIGGYLGGNIINLLRFFNIDLKGFDFSNIPIWGADLQDTELHEVNFTNSDLSNSNFAEDLACIHSIVFCPHGDYFATGEANGNIRLWQTSDYKQITKFTDGENHNHQVWSVAFSPDGEILASGGEDKKIRLWDVKLGNKLNELKDNQCVYSVTFSDDGNILASAGDEGITFWDASTGRQINTITRVKNVNSVAFIGSHTLVSGSQDGTVVVWSINNINHPKCLRSWQEHEKPVRCVAFNLKNATIASGSEDGTIRLWKTNSERSICTLKAQMKQVWTVAFSQDSRVLASGSSDYNPSGMDDDHNIRLWSLDNGKCLHILRTYSNQVRTIAFCQRRSQTPGLNLLICGGDDHTINIWDTNLKQCQKVIKGYTNRIWSTAFSPNGNMLVSGSEDNKIRLWNLKNKKSVIKELALVLQGHTDWVWSVVFHPLDENRLASASEDNTIRLWQLKNGHWQKEATLREHSDRVRIVTFSPDGNKLVSAGNDRKIIVWNVFTHKVINCLDKDSHGHKARVLSLAFSPDGHLIASSSRDRTIRLWNYQTNTVDILEGHEGQVHSIAFSPDGNYLISGSFDNKLKLWDIRNQECIETFEKHEDRILTVTFSPVGLLFASGGHDQTIRLWNLESKECLSVLEGHEGAVESLMFHPKGELLVSGSQDQTLKIWNTYTGKCIDTVKINSKPYEGLKIFGARGLTVAQKDTLVAFGAIADREAYN